MANLAIKGHRIQGDKVIKLLEILGGKNNHYYLGLNDSWVYYINKEGCITLDFDVSRFSVFTLEEFIEKFPYKVGDKVIYKSEVFPIIGMKWSCSNITVIYTMKSNYDTIDCYDSTWMKPYKEETMDKASKAVFDASAQCCDISNKIIKKETMEKEIYGAIVDRFICLEGYDFYDDKGNIIDTKEIIMKKRQPKYPKTYEECCKVLKMPKDESYIDIDVPLSYNKVLKAFTKLLICRDAYWKIARDWKPNFNDETIKFVITNYRGDVYTSIINNYNRILSFPTEEMRDAFYENFKELIEECKELL